MRRPGTTAATRVTALLGLLAGLAACAPEPVDPPVPGTEPLAGAVVVVGARADDEQLLLGQIAVQALEAAGAQVEDRTGFERVLDLRAALLSGDVDVAWDYTGSGWVVHLGLEPQDAPDDPGELAAEVRRLDAGNGVVWLDPASADNGYEIVTSADHAREHRVQDLSDYVTLLNGNAAAAGLCAAPEFLGRIDGWAGVERAYGIEMPEGRVTETSVDEVVPLVAEADPCGFGEVFGTDGRIASEDLEIVEDDRGVFVSYNPAVTVGLETYEAYGTALAELFDPITAELTTDTLIGLNARVTVDGEDPATVAADFLAAIETS